MSQRKCICCGAPVDKSAAGFRYNPHQTVKDAVQALSALECKKLWNDTFVTWSNSRAFKAAIIKALK